MKRHYILDLAEPRVTCCGLSGWYETTGFKDWVTCKRCKKAVKNIKEVRDRRAKKEAKKAITSAVKNHGLTKREILNAWKRGVTEHVMEK